MSQRPGNNQDVTPSEQSALQEALQAAAATWPHPNPRVGAVVLSTAGTVVGTGVHKGPGATHAEVEAIEAAGEAAFGGTLVVTLEPCNHHGRTPPCTEAIHQSGIRRVVIGALDPDERVSGSGIERLRTLGIDVHDAIAPQLVQEADPAYFHHRRSGRARVTLKLAATLDGQVAAADGSSQWITGPEARADVHRIRSESDGVAVGAGTARTDNPKLTVRLDAHEGPQPRPVLIAGREVIPPDLALFERSPLVYSPHPGPWPDSTELVEVASSDGRVDLSAVIRDLPNRGVLELLVEGGPTLAGALSSAGLVDRYVLYLGARLGQGGGRSMFDGVFATLADARSVEIDSVVQLGPDLRVEFRPAIGGRQPEAAA